MQEFDLDGAIKRKPQLVLIDELAHTNSEGCRHHKRYQDVRELLMSGIDVYTTVNVHQIESLHDTVASITGIPIQERIPDYVFDDADQVKLVDLEPQELIERLKSETYDLDFSQTARNIFHSGNSDRLKRDSLRRCADRVNKLTESSRIRSHGDYHTDEHILVCLSSSPSNAKIIRTAAEWPTLSGTFTALFVETSGFASMSALDRQRLRANIYLAQQLGATIETVYGDNLLSDCRICPFVRSIKNCSWKKYYKRHILGKPTLTEQLIASAPNIDIQSIIPDQITGLLDSCFQKASAPYFFHFRYSKKY